jgi:hypothetical protein
VPDVLREQAGILREFAAQAEDAAAPHPFTEPVTPADIIQLARLKADELASEATSLEVLPACRVCGCTEDRPCDGGCHWVADPQMGELCSRCVNAVLLVTAVDLVDGETGVRAVPEGNYAVICSEPCHIADIQHDLAARTDVITLKGVRHR